MGYISRELSSSAKKIVPVIFLIALWLITFIDVFTGRLVNGKMIYFSGGLTVILVLGFLFSKYAIDLNKRKTIQETKQEAALLNTTREQEIRKLIEKDADFMTLCYQCSNYDQEVQICLLESSQKLSHVSDRDIRINGKKYCVYWIPLTQASSISQYHSSTLSLE